MAGCEACGVTGVGCVAGTVQRGRVGTRSPLGSQRESRSFGGEGVNYQVSFAVGVMKLVRTLVLLLPSFGFAVGFNSPPYPSSSPPYPGIYPGPLPAYPSGPDLAYPPPSVPSPPVTACTITAGTYRLDAYDLAKTEHISLRELVFYMHVSNVGMITMRAKLKPKRGREEQFVVMPYSTSSDLMNVCSGTDFSFFFRGINVYGKTLSGNFAGRMSGGKLVVDGWAERFDAAYNSKVTVNLTGHAFEFVYPYLQ